MAAYNFNQEVYISSDTGVTWSSTITITGWTSAYYWTRLTLVYPNIAATSPSGIYISTNFASTWTLTSAPASWTGIAADTSFTYLVAVINGGSIYWSSSGLIL